MHVETDYWIQETDILDFARIEGLIEHDRLLPRLSITHEVRPLFLRKLHALMHERKTPESASLEEIYPRCPELDDLAFAIYEQYHHAFAYKLTMGETYADQHPGVSIDENKGYQAGATYVDIMTQEALSKLSKLEVNDDAHPLGQRRMTDQEALKLLAAIIKDTLHTVRILKPRDEDPRVLEPTKQKLLVIDPRPRLLGEQKGTPDNIIDTIKAGPRISGRRWRDPKQVAGEDFLESLRTSNQQGTDNGRG